MEKGKIILSEEEADTNGIYYDDSPLMNALPEGAKLDIFSEFGKKSGAEGFMKEYLVPVEGMVFRLFFVDSRHSGDFERYVHAAVVGDPEGPVIEPFVIEAPLIQGAPDFLKGRTRVIVGRVHESIDPANVAMIKHRGEYMTWDEINEMMKEREE